MKKNLIIIFLFIHVNTYIILPFNQLNQKLELLINNNDITNIITRNPILNLYTTIFMGDTPYKILVKISPYNNYFSFIPIPKTNFNFTDYIRYNPFLSKSLHRNKNINYKEEFREVTDVFYFITNEEEISNIYLNEKKLELKEDKYKPYLYLNFFVSNWHFSDFYTGLLGLGKNSPNYPYANFIQELKSKSVINNSIWSVNFNYEDIKNISFQYDRGNLIIGEYPHVYNPNEYAKENYYKLELLDDKNNNDWVIKIDNSFIIKQGEVRTSAHYIKYINIIFGLYTMQAPYFLFEQLTALFFQKYFDTKICQSKKISKDNEEKIFIFCSKKSFDINQQKLFPKIIFKIKHPNNLFQFELNYTDVFFTKSDIVYFLINFNSNGRQDMIKVGQIFLFKYKLVFDYDNIEIGLYIENKIKNREDKEIIILIFIIFILLCFILYGYKKGWWCIEKMKSRKIK